MTASQRALELAAVAALAGYEKKAHDVVALDVSERLALTDAFVLMTGDKERHVSSIVDFVEEKLHEAGVKAVRKEGQALARWVLLDFGEIIVHVMHEEDRGFYSIERLWADGPAIELPEDPALGSEDDGEEK